MGLQVLNACLVSNIRVPEDVAVLGVDNDASIAELASPPLSSIILNGEGAGYRAAQLLDRWMGGEPAVTGKIYQLAPAGVAWRRSTDVFAVEDPYVAKALRMIQQEACAGLRVAEVVGRVPLARRQLEMRFKRPYAAHSSLRSGECSAGVPRSCLRRRTFPWWMWRSSVDTSISSTSAKFSKKWWATLQASIAGTGGA